MNRSLKILMLAAIPVMAVPAAAAPASMFLRTAAQGDNSEVTLGNLAVQRGGSAAVRNFGRTLARDHGSHLVRVRALARAMRITLPGGMKPDARMAYQRLRTLRGAAFDREFARHMVMDHRTDIAAYQAQARTGDRQTAMLARNTLPVLREHLRIAQSLR
jgi:putative membrane protein